jgi:outer membrane lipoprotein carrier protein
MRLMRCAVLALGLLPALVQAGVASERLYAFFSEITALRCDFVQRLQSGDAGPVEESQGELTMLRPDRFRWDYRKPFEQQIVADGKRLWIYDPELEQVIVKPLDEALSSTPALLLSGQGSLEEQFIISELPARDSGLEWVRLEPKRDDAGFQSVQLGFDAQNLRRMELLDAFGQRTQIEFMNIQRNPKLDPKLFNFTPPPGVDVVGEGARP